MGINFLIFSIFFPSLKLGSFNITLLDFLPFVFLFLLFIRRKGGISFPSFSYSLIFYLNIGFIFLWFILTLISFYIFLDVSGFVKSFLQLYRRIIDFVFIPLFILLIKDYPLTYTVKSLSLFAILSSVFGFLINLSDSFRLFYLSNIDSSSQVFVYPYFRNMGTIGEASYFALILMLVLFINLITPDYKYKKSVMFFLLISIVSTASKSTIFTLFIGYLVFVITGVVSINIVFLIIPIAFIFIYMLYRTDYMTMINTYIDLANESFRERLDIVWNIVLENFEKNDLFYIFGLGFKGLKSYLGIEGTHNMFLASIIDFGILFGILYFPTLFLVHILIVWRIFPQNWKIFFIAIFIVEFIISFVHDTFYHYKVLAVYFFILFYLLKEVSYENRTYTRLVGNISRC